MKLVISEQQVKNLLNKLADKAMSVIHKNEPVQQNTNQIDVYTTTKNEWSKINLDNSNPRGFGEGTNVREDIARKQAILNAEAVMLKKMGVDKVQMGVGVENEKTFKNPDNTYTCLVIVNKTQ